MVEDAEERTGYDLTAVGMDMIEDALAAPPPEIMKVREVAGRMMEVVGPVR